MGGEILRARHPVKTNERNGKINGEWDGALKSIPFGFDGG